MRRIRTKHNKQNPKKNKRPIPNKRTKKQYKKGLTTPRAINKKPKHNPTIHKANANSYNTNNLYSKA